MSTCIVQATGIKHRVDLQVLQITGTPNLPLHGLVTVLQEMAPIGDNHSQTRLAIMAAGETHHLLTPGKLVEAPTENLRLVGTRVRAMEVILAEIAEEW